MSIFDTPPKSTTGTYTETANWNAPNSSRIFQSQYTGDNLPDCTNASMQNQWCPPGFGGIPADYSGLSSYAYQQQTQTGRGPIPEDTARSLFNTMFETLVHAESADRYKAVRMLVEAYDLPI